MLGTKQVLSISSSIIPISLPLNPPGKNTSALHPVKSRVGIRETERI